MKEMVHDLVRKLEQIVADGEVGFYLQMVMMYVCICVLFAFVFVYL